MAGASRERTRPSQRGPQRLADMVLQTLACLIKCNIKQIRDERILFLCGRVREVVGSGKWEPTPAQHGTASGRTSCSVGLTSTELCIMCEDCLPLGRAMGTRRDDVTDM